MRPLPDWFRIYYIVLGREEQVVVFYVVVEVELGGFGPSAATQSFSSSIHVQLLPHFDSLSIPRLNETYFCLLPFKF